MLKLSVIISCYSAEKMISVCLQSLLDQTYENIEIIVVDAHSPDNTVQIIKQNFSKIVLIEAKERIGVGAALNLGLKQCTGDIVVIDFNTDETADKFWAENIVRTHEKLQMKYIVSPTRLKSNLKVDAYCSMFRFHTGTQRIGMNKEYNPNLPLRECEFTGITSFPHSVLEKVGFVDEDYEFYGADADFNVRARLAGYRVISQSRAFTVHQRSATSLLNYRKHHSRMSFGIIRLSTLHGTKKRLIVTYSFFLVYKPFYLIFKSMINILSGGKLGNKFTLYLDELIGNFTGAYRNLKYFPRDYRKRKQFPIKMLK